MKTEISTAAGFITRLLRTPGGIGDEELRCFSESLQEALRGEAAARDGRPPPSRSPPPFRLLPQCRRRDERDGTRRPSAAGTAVLSPKRTSVQSRPRRNGNLSRRLYRGSNSPNPATSCPPSRPSRLSRPFAVGSPGAVSGPLRARHPP